MNKSLVVVESPTKAKTLTSFLSDEFDVIATYGHVVDLPSRAEVVEVENNFNLKYEIVPKAKAQIDEIKKKAKGASEIFLATDPDREGEAIAWHIANQLEDSQRQKAKRITFHEITKSAVKTAIDSPHEINLSLVEAQTTRRTLDHLMGIRLSQVLWRKIPKSLSAGRVQSAVLRLMCEREMEVLLFKPKEYWNVDAEYSIGKNKIKAHLSKISPTNSAFQDGQILSSSAVENILNEFKDLKKSTYEVETRQRFRSPLPPFCTSTLQQAASQMLGFSPQKTMSVAQKLYEGIKIDGKQQSLITYIRTDSVTLSKGSVEKMRSCIVDQFGADMLVSTPRQFHTKTKNAQEAHEAIRPTNPALMPDMTKQGLAQDEWKLYKLIWSRALATQAIDAEHEVKKFVAKHYAKDGTIFEIRKEATRLVKEGFLKIYEDDDQEQIISEDFEFMIMAEKNPSAISMHEPTSTKKITPPPPRYSVGGIIKQMEKAGIGRPSTYSSTLSVLENRGYVISKDKKLQPTPIGYIVNSFLTKFFGSYTDAGFTAAMEDELDEISRGEMQRLTTLNKFWSNFHETLDEVSQLKQGDVLDQIRSDSSDYVEALLTVPVADKVREREEVLCPKCGKSFTLKFGRFGVFFGCQGYPDCKTTIESKSLLAGGAIAKITSGVNAEDEIANSTQIKVGRFGPYISFSDKAKNNISIAEKTLPYVKPHHLEIIETFPLELKEKLSDIPIMMMFGRRGFFLECGPIKSFLMPQNWPQSQEEAVNFAGAHLIKNFGLLKIENDQIKISGTISNDGTTLTIGRKKVELKEALNILIKKWTEGEDLPTT